MYNVNGLISNQLSSSFEDKLLKTSFESPNLKLIMLSKILKDRKYLD